jgi:hypothetical protein
MTTSNYFFGRTKEEQIGNQPQYFYGLRRNSDGELFLTRVNQLSRTDYFEINTPGQEVDDYTNFEIGTDFYENRDVYHNIVHANLIYEQYRWDDRNVWYYVDASGRLSALINTKYTYPTGISS